MRIYKNELDTETKEIAESLLFNGNGFIGVRNCFDEQYYTDYYTNRHTYVNGFYDIHPIDYPEIYYGAANMGEQMLPVIDGQTTKIKIGDEEVDITKNELIEHVRYIDITKGISVRKLHIKHKENVETKITITKLASFTKQEQVSTKYEFEKIGHELPIKLETHINFNTISSSDVFDPRTADNVNEVIIDEVDINKKNILFSAKNSQINCYFKWHTSGINEAVTANEERIIIECELNNESYIKSFSYSLKDFIEIEEDFEYLAQEQEKYLIDFWESSKITIESVDDLEESLNYGSYALLSSLGTNNKSSIAAKGLSGLGYEGHVFWDAEMYVFPYFVRTNPNKAKSMLMYRINMLEQAKENRKLVGYERGALYAWRTISGIESSSFFEAGMAQHHINLDIAFALIKYIELTGDNAILNEGGWEMLFEIVDMFSSIVHKKADKYHLDKVTGPDEYSALVDDNFYTNSLLKYVIRNLLDYNDEYMHKLSDDKYELFYEIMNKINLPYSEELKIYSQDRDFLNKGLWPQKEMKQPLLLNYHPLYIYRYQVCKQADVVLALHLLYDELNNEEYIRNTIEYYDDITTHDSSLSFSTFSTVYAKLKHEKAYEFFLKNARLDLDNLHHNTRDGIHTASMGGTYQTIVEGFANMHLVNDELCFTNNLPKEISRIEFCTYYKGDKYYVKIVGREKPIVEKRRKNEKSSII